MMDVKMPMLPLDFSAQMKHAAPGTSNASPSAVITSTSSSPVVAAMMMDLTVQTNGGGSSSICSPSSSIVESGSPAAGGARQPRTPNVHNSSSTSMTLHHRSPPLQPMHLGTATALPAAAGAAGDILKGSTSAFTVVTPKYSDGKIYTNVHGVDVTTADDTTRFDHTGVLTGARDREDALRTSTQQKQPKKSHARPSVRIPTFHRHHNSCRSVRSVLVCAHIL